VPETENHPGEEIAAFPPDPSSEQVISKLKYFISKLPAILDEEFGTGFSYKNPALAIEVLGLMVKLHETEYGKALGSGSWRWFQFDRFKRKK